MRTSSLLMRAAAAVIFVLASATTPVFAQFILPHFIFGGGAGAAQNNDFAVAGIVGQSVLGTTSNSDLIHVAGFWAQLENLITSVEPVSDTVPDRFELRQNFPNPFNPSTTIQFALPKKSTVTLKVFDLLGREVVSLIDEEMPAGEYKLTFEAGELPSGTYFYRLKAGGFTRARRLTLMK